jgi:hypothetical protein
MNWLCCSTASRRLGRRPIRSVRLPPQADLAPLRRLGSHQSLEQIAAIKDAPVPEWPEFHVKLNPISLGRVLPISWDETMHTMSSGVVLTPGDSNLPLTFAEGVYELLGAPHRGGRGRRYVPISTLSEGGNAYLRGVLTGQTTPASCADFWSHFSVSPIFNGRHSAGKTKAPKLPSHRQSPPERTKRSLPASSRAPAPHCQSEASAFRMPFSRTPPCNHPSTHATRRKLHPLHLFARTIVQDRSFIVSRGLHYRASCRKPPTMRSSPKEIGRVHVLLERTGSTITIRDGNGEQRA